MSPRRRPTLVGLPAGALACAAFAVTAASPARAAVVGDLTGDGLVNAADVNLVTAHWLETGIPGSVVGDANVDGAVNLADVNFLTAHWRAAVLNLGYSITPVDFTGGVYAITLRARVVGTGHPTQGDGGLSDLQFAVVSAGSGLSNAVAAAGAGPLAGKAKITWDPAITSAFGVVNPARTDLGADGDADLNGAALFDPDDFVRTDLGVAGYQDIATFQFQLTGAGLYSGDTLHVVPSNAQYYDFISGRAPNFRRPFDSMAGVDIHFPLLPEPDVTALTSAALLPLLATRARGSRVARPSTAKESPCAPRAFV